MRKAGLRSKTAKKFKVTTASDHDHPVAENLLNRNFSIKEPDKAWVGDITYIWTRERWLYPAVLLDLLRLHPGRRVLQFARRREDTPAQRNYLIFTL
jgi:transposase InsO family protein